MKANGKCLEPGCTKQAVTRGLCITAYGAAAQLVRRKKTTWADLEKRGKVLPPRHGTKGKHRAWLLERKGASR